MAWVPMIAERDGTQNWAHAPCESDSSAHAGRAPLHLACLQTGTLKIVEALIEGGADPTQQTTDGWLAVDAAHTVGALTDELRRLLTKAVALKAPEGHAFVDDVDD